MRVSVVIVGLMLAGCSSQSIIIHNAGAIDGDTFAVGQTHYRLTFDETSYPDAPELPGHCRVGRACAPGDPFQAKALLQSMLNDGVSCQSFGLDLYGRTLVNCYDLVSGHNIGEQLVAEHLAQVCVKLSHHTACKE